MKYFYFRRQLLLVFTILAVNTLYAQYDIVNKAIGPIDCHCYTLTPDQNQQSGAVWNKFKINLTQSFDFKFSVFFGASDRAGADGIAFVLQPLNTSIWSEGGGMGYGGISPSVGITMDTYYNNAVNDPINGPAEVISPDGLHTNEIDHIAIQFNGAVEHNDANNPNQGTKPVAISDTSINVEDGKFHAFRVTWNAVTKTYTAYIDGSKRVEIMKDLVKDIFHNDPMVYWGLTGSTGGAKNLQQFCTALTPNFYFPANQKICVNEPIQFIDSTQSFAPLVSHEWDFGDNSPKNTTDMSPIHTYTVPGEYTATLYVLGIDGCTEIFPKKITVGGKPVAVIDVKDGCAESTIAYKDMSTVVAGTFINKWEWDLGLGQTSTLQNPTLVFAPFVTGHNSAFNVKLKVTSNLGCVSDIAETGLTIFGHPVAKFDQTPACNGVASSFTDKSDFSGLNLPEINGTINKWQWDFENALTAATQNPSLVLTAANTKATLIVTSSNGCASKPVTQAIGNSAKPTASFTISVNQKYCVNVPVIFSDASLPAASIVKHEWDFGDGTTDNVNANPSHAYAIAKDYKVVLKVTNASGCAEQFEKNIKIADKPTADFIVQNTCANKQVSFTDNSNGGTIDKWNWDLGFGATVTEKNPVKLYEALVNGTNNNIDIGLTVTSIEGCVSDPVTKPLKIYMAPVAKFSQAGACTGVQYKFKDESFFTTADATLNGTINKWSWDFGSGIISDQKDPSLLLNSATNTNALLIVTSSNGCESASSTQLITSAILPVADFDPGTICATATEVLTDKSKTLDGSAIVNWNWDLGNGSQSTTKNPSTVYPNAGNVDVKLDVKGANGCVASVTKTITVSALPQAAIASLNGQYCENRLVQLSDLSVATAGTTINNWSWKIDNATAMTAQNPLKYFTSGNHTITLTVKNNIGCESTVAQAVFYVNAKPVIDYSFPGGACKKESVQLTGINNSAETIDKWFWRFGDNTIGNVQSPAHSYSSNKLFNVELYAISTNGCYSDTIKNKSITIYGTDASAGQDIIASFNQPVQLNATGGDTYKWTPAIGLNNPNSASPVATLTKDQKYIVTAYTSQGCESSDEINIKVYAGPEIYVPTAFTPDGSGVNDVFRATPAGITVFEEFSVYNRLGQLIFTTADYRRGWDGTYKGTAQNNGVYIWIAKGIDYKGNKIFRKGTVTLIR